MDTRVSVSTSTRGFAAMISIVAMASLLLQYVILIDATRNTIGPALATLRFFSFFTILCNLLMALATAFAVFGQGARSGRFFARAQMRGGIALYAAVTFCVYFTILRHLWQPQGAQWWADSGLHYAMPALYLMWWLWCVPHGQLRWRDVAGWLLLPLAYLAWTFVRGAWLHEYPYPFIDVDQLGLVTVLRNSVVVLALFVVLGVALVALDRMLGRTRDVRASA